MKAANRAKIPWATKAGWDRAEQLIMSQPVGTQEAALERASLVGERSVSQYRAMLRRMLKRPDRFRIPEDQFNTPEVMRRMLDAAKRHGQRRYRAIATEVQPYIGDGNWPLWIVTREVTFRREEISVLSGDLSNAEMWVQPKLRALALFAKLSNLRVSIADLRRSTGLSEARVKAVLNGTHKAKLGDAMLILSALGLQFAIATSEGEVLDLANHVACQAVLERAILLGVK